MSSGPCHRSRRCRARRSAPVRRRRAVLGHVPVGRVVVGCGLAAAAGRSPDVVGIDHPGAFLRRATGSRRDRDRPRTEVHDTVRTPRSRTGDLLRAKNGRGVAHRCPCDRRVSGRPGSLRPTCAVQLAGSAWWLASTATDPTMRPTGSLRRSTPTDGVVMVGHVQHDIHGIHRPRETGTTACMLNVSVDDVDAHHSRAVAARHAGAERRVLRRTPLRVRRP